VHALKYEGWRELAREMGASMAGVVAPTFRTVAEPPPVVVYVPTTRERERHRGYNQAELLARSLAGCLRLQVVPALIRTRGGATQVSLHPSQRRANVKGVFRARDDAVGRVRNARVILVDDVLTTGATAGAAAAELARMEASEVTLVTYARALPFRRGTRR
jgi:ComF family protein